MAGHEEQEIIAMLERTKGRKLTEQEIDLSLGASARAARLILNRHLTS